MRRLGLNRKNFLKSRKLSDYDITIFAKSREIKVSRNMATYIKIREIKMSRKFHIIRYILPSRTGQGYEYK